jgi:predicted  nucleic acid-binding Zn-ribbon protein
MEHTRESKKRAASTRHKISVVEGRIAELNAQITERQQALVNNMLLLRDLETQSAKKVLQDALTPRLRRRLAESPDSTRSGS